MYPETVLGKILASFVFVWGIFLLALPIAIIGSNFSNVYNEEFTKQKIIDTNEKKNNSRIKSILN